MKTVIAVVWKESPISCTVEARNAKIVRLRATGQRRRSSGGRFSFSKRGPCRLDVTVESARPSLGPNSPIVKVTARTHAFSFFLRDVSDRFPIVVPDYGVAVVAAADKRTYEKILSAVERRSLQTALARLAVTPEESFENAARHSRNLVCPTWLGLGRDVRIFELGFEYQGQWDHYVTPRFHNTPVKPPELDGKGVQYNFMVGRGVGCSRNITRRLEDGCLPIVHAAIEDGQIHFDCTAFVTLESRPLTQNNVRGTHFLVAESFSFGFMHTSEQARKRDRLLPGEIDHGEEPVLYFRAVATNRAAAPRYAWFKSAVAAAANTWTAPKKSQDGRFDSGRVYAVSKVNGQPMPQEEMAVLLAPDASCTFEFRIPHSPISAARAARLAKQDFDGRHAQCRAFWLAKLDRAARVKLPEKRIDEMVRACLIHLDLVAFGREPGGTVAASVGRYCPIGSESSPIIQAMDSFGWSDLARRAAEYFLDKQHDDGFIQNFERYMLETGPALWTLGEHYRYTRDDAWARRIAPKLVKSCDYMTAWSRRNRRRDLEGQGYGLLDGKVGDPEDPYRIFMLNGYAYVGMARVAEMLAKVNPRQSRRIRREAETLKRLIRMAFFEGVARSPLVPLGDGTWCPTAPPWADGVGPACLYAEKINAYTHATFVARDSIIGPMYLVLSEVLESREPAADWLVKYHTEHFHDRNAAFSQPFLSVHPKVHLMRGEVEAFLAAYYNTASALPDRETYTFWEHTFQASPHKTHEVGEFLMQTRHMLYMEDGQTLRLLPGVPRSWLENGKEIALERVATYFGPASLRVSSRLDAGEIEAEVTLPAGRAPRKVALRLPHPQGRSPKAVSGGTYDAATETVTLTRPGRRNRVKLVF